jgi:hypothetical protein
MAKKKPSVSAADVSQAHKMLLKSVAGTGRLASKLRGDREFGRRLAERQYRKFLAEGGKAGDWMAFLDWLMENLPKIIALIMTLFPA